MKKGKFSGIITPLITPFKEDGEIDFDGFKSLLNFLQDKVDGMFVNATTGEFTSLTLDEKIEILKFVKDSVRNNVKLFSNVTSTCFNDIKKLVEVSNNLNYDAIVITPPYFLVPDIKGMKNYFLSVSKISNIPLLIYNIPACTGYSLSVEIIKELAITEEKISGVKATIDSLNYIKDLIVLIKTKREDFSVLTGVELYLAPTLLSGGDGGIVALSNFAPNLLKKVIFDYEKGDFYSLNETHKKILNLFEVYKYSSSFAGAIKITLNLLGFPINRNVRLPLFKDNEDSIQRIKEILINLKLLTKE
ncbi:MAG: dihydrodipicolinate synthase family protein [Caldisericia bacterium]